jgi:hypothetical protein
MAGHEMSMDTAVHAALKSGKDVFGRWRKRTRQRNPEESSSPVSAIKVDGAESKFLEYKYTALPF